MKSIQSLEATEPQWEQPSRKERRYELRAGDDAVLRVRWATKHGARAFAESAAGGWEIDKQGIVRPRITIRPIGSTLELATFYGSWDGGGRLEFRDGRAYTWANTNFLHTAWQWTNSLDRPLLRFKGKTMVIEPAGRTLPEITLLAALSWYLNIMSKRASDAGAAAAIVATGF